MPGHQRADLLVLTLFVGHEFWEAGDANPAIKCITQTNTIAGGIHSIPTCFHCLLLAALFKGHVLFPFVFIAGPVNNGPVTACALLARHSDCRRSGEGFNVRSEPLLRAVPAQCMHIVISSVVHERVGNRM